MSKDGKKVKWLAKETNVRMMFALQHKALRPSELGKATGIKSRNLISKFLKVGRQSGILEAVIVDAQDRPSAMAYRLSAKGHQVLYHFKEIENLLESNSPGNLKN